MRTAAEDQVDVAAQDPKDDPFEEVLRGLKEATPDGHFERLITGMSDGFEMLGIAAMPTPQQWTLVRTKQADPDVAQRVSANRMLFNFCVRAFIDQDGVVVVKSKNAAELAPLVKRYPALVDTWAGEIAEMAGAVKGTRREKA